MVTRILLVDDSSTDLLIIKNMLSDFEVLTARNGVEALKQIELNPDIRLVVLDLNMPIMDGFELLQIFKSDKKYQQIRVIILTNLDEVENEIRGLELGAVDYIRKPVNIRALKIRINIHRKLLALQNELEESNSILDARVAKATEELVLTRDITIHALVGLIEARNFESYNHIMRTSMMMKALCTHLRKNPKFANILTREYILELTRTSPLHDIGKVAIPDHILLKPGKLTSEEFEIMKRHVEYGVLALKKEIGDVDEAPSFIRTALDIVGYHHEKFDGSGYPNKLKGEQIPLPGRLMAIIDVFDALINERVYKKAFSLEQSLAIIKEGIGTHFDPDIGHAFLQVIDKMTAINDKYTQ
ncbi:MAG: response regulator [Bacilli bacterium]|jgi:putative two-component system response regulator|nr:response regulator [Bacilli bacterium]